MNEDSKQIRILAVDDHPVLRQRIPALIADELDMTVVGEAAAAKRINSFARTPGRDANGLAECRR